MPNLTALQHHPAAFRLAILILVTLAARAATFGSPLVHVDEAFYLTVADAMRHGALPYVDIWDRKPVGLFLLYLPAASLGLPASLYGYQAMAAASVVATAWLVARLAERAGWHVGALPAAVFYILWLNLGDGQGGQTPVFYNLLTAGAALLVLRADRSGRRAPGIAAMLLIGVGLQLKYTVVFEGAAFGAWLSWADWRNHRSAARVAGYAVVLGAVSILPTALAAGVYAALGHFDAWLFANALSILHRKPDAPGLQHLFLRDTLAIMIPLVFALAGLRTPVVDLHARRIGVLLRAWLVIAIVAVAAFGGWYNHYMLPIMLPGAICAASLFERRAQSWLWAAIPLGALFIAGQAVLRSERAHRGSAHQFAALTRAIGRGPGGLFIYSGPVLLYPATGRPALTRFLFPSHLEFRREAGSIGVDQAAEISRIFARAPAVVVMGPPIAEEYPAIRALVTRELGDRGYVASPLVILGRDPVQVYRRPLTS